MWAGWAAVALVVSTCVAATAMAQTDERVWAATALPARDDPVPQATAAWPVENAPASPAATVGGLVLLSVLSPLYNRLDKRRLFESEVRRRVVVIVHEAPGVSMNAMADELGVHYRTIRHHVEKLQHFGVVTVVRRGRRLYVTPAGREPELPPSASRPVLEAVAEAPGRHLASIARAVARSKSTVRWHLTRLEARDLVRVERDGGLTRTYPTARARQLLSDGGGSGPGPRHR